MRVVSAVLVHADLRDETRDLLFVDELHRRVVTLILGLVLLVLHNSAWASAWVTASAILYVMLVVWSVLVGVLNHRSEGR